MSNRLIALDKKPGFRPIGNIQIWRRLMAKTVVRIAGPVATDACGADQLCAGLKAGIEGGHACHHTLLEKDGHGTKLRFVATCLLMLAHLSGCGDGVMWEEAVNCVSTF